MDIPINNLYCILKPFSKGCFGVLFFSEAYIGHVWKTLAIAIIGVHLCTSSFCAFDGPTDWSASRGKATTALGAGASAYWGNPSGILDVNALSVFVDLHREWGLDKLSTGRISGVLTKDRGSLAIGGSFTGDVSFYTESSVGICYGRKIGKLGLAARLNMGMVKSSDWSASAPIVGIGASYPAGKIVTLGVWCDNITASKLDGNNLPIRGAAGLEFGPTDWINLSADLYFEDDNPATMRFGQEIILVKTVFLRSGVIFRPNSYHFGLGTKMRDFEFCWAYIGHPELGGSTILTLAYEK